MERNLENHLIRVCTQKIRKEGINCILSLEHFFCDRSIDIKFFALLTDWWFKQNEFGYLVPASQVLATIYSNQLKIETDT